MCYSQAKTPMEMEFLTTLTMMMTTTAFRTIKKVPLLTHNFIISVLDADGDGVPDLIDNDDDNDGIPDDQEGADTDGDGIPDDEEGKWTIVLRFQIGLDLDGDGIPDLLDNDDDNDGVPDDQGQ